MRRTLGSCLVALALLVVLAMAGPCDDAGDKNTCWVKQAKVMAKSDPRAAVSVCTDELTDVDWTDWCLATVGPEIASVDPARGASVCDMVEDGSWKSKCRSKVGDVPEPAGPPPDTTGATSYPMLMGGLFALILLAVVKFKLMAHEPDQHVADEGDEMSRVKRYVAEQRTQGHDDNDIRAMLNRHDYPGDVIDKVLE
ncbi:MAG: hypothetical protein QF415_13375 [Candidatus Undinarchaeales archaeon]|nr:hypothetical protein [Candidatus Undinarchaeales archaeon]MDP7494575.1 hypothetical protein [Candidatus Undinarchaeales archaeon]